MTARANNSHRQLSLQLKITDVNRSSGLSHARSLLCPPARYRPPRGGPAPTAVKPLLPPVNMQPANHGPSPFPKSLLHSSLSVLYPPKPKDIAAICPPLPDLVIRRRGRQRRRIPRRHHLPSPAPNPAALRWTVCLRPPAQRQVRFSSSSDLKLVIPDSETPDPGLTTGATE
jgi:hypothetical protein